MLGFRVSLAFWSRRGRDSNSRSPPLTKTAFNLCPVASSRLLSQDGSSIPILLPGWAVRFPLTLIRRDWTLFFVGFRRWRKRARWARHKLNAAPSTMRIVVIAATVLAVFSATNLVYQIVRKPTEMLFPVSGAMNKMPAETWQQYAPLFREYSTSTITPEPLAALAQVEGAGNPVAGTYWRS